MTDASAEKSTSDVLGMLSELAMLTALDEGSKQAFKVRAYETARDALEGTDGDITSFSRPQLEKISGVGRATASKVREFLETGSVQKLEALRAEYPPSVIRISQISGVGPKLLKLMRSELGIESLEDLQQAIQNEELRTLPGMGAKSETSIGNAIQRLGLAGKEHRTPIADALPVAERLVADIKSMDGVVDAAFCGSLRRFSETVGDIDVTVAVESDATAEPNSFMAYLVEMLSGHELMSEVLLSGESKTSFLTPSSLQVDLRVVTEDQFGAATLYFTGSKAHNIALRQRAINQGMILNEYGLFETEVVESEDGPSTSSTRRTGALVAASTEVAVYDALNMDFVVPPMREGLGEVSAAARDEAGELPLLVQVNDIRGDLHYHTDRSGDGRSTVEEMVAVAASRGYEYLAITDHGEDLTINGSSEAEMVAHREHIAEVQQSYPATKLLWGCELNISASGNLDYSDAFRATFDYTVASVHSAFSQSRDAQTKRLVKAISDPTVDSIGHLTGRYIGRRPGIELDIDIVLEALYAFDVALEINGALKRLDAASDVVRKAVRRGVKLVINTDSHHTSELGRIEFGVKTAQRGWAPKDQVVNTWPRERFLEWVSSHRSEHTGPKLSRRAEL